MPSEFEDELLGTYIEHEEYEEDPGTGYRWLNPWAVASVVFGLLSLLTMLGWILVLVPLVGITLGIVALSQIGRAGQEMLGYLKKWLTSHIMGEDMAFRRYWERSPRI